MGDFDFEVGVPTSNRRRFHRTSFNSAAFLVEVARSGSVARTMTTGLLDRGVLFDRPTVDFCMVEMRGHVTIVEITPVTPLSMNHVNRLRGTTDDLALMSYATDTAFRSFARHAPPQVSFRAAPRISTD